MKKPLIAMVLSTVLTTPTLANEWVLGASFGLLRPGGDSGETSSALTGSGSIAFEFLNLGALDVGATLEFMKGISQAEVDNQDADVSARAMWLTARTLGPLYVIARTGLIELKLDPVAGGLDGEREKALSVGLGFSTGMRSELLYTRVEHDRGDATHWIQLLWGF